ncbi:MAG TPA: outer membrane beta-barrel protein [Bradyrhizobium sp.]|nr:outer membrane beta-barrel protein [Bradyrhizobium sp.]
MPARNARAKRCLSAGTDKFGVASTGIIRNGGSDICICPAGGIVRRYFARTVATVISLGVAGIGAASAADMAVKARPMVAPVMTYDWTGCYIGGNVGGGWHRIEQTGISAVGGAAFVPPLDFGSSEGSSVIGGAQIGCDYQFAGRWVVGVQGMFDFGNIRSRNTPIDPLLVRTTAPFTQTRTRDIFTATGRLGYLLAPQVLAYVKGGGAWTNTFTEVYGTIPSTFLSESVSSDRSGWTVGGGLEWMFAPGWSVFGEYNYMDFGRRDIAFIAGPNTLGAPTVNSTRLTMQTALIGVNYKFNWAGPVVAKY